MRFSLVHHLPPAALIVVLILAVAGAVCVGSIAEIQSAYDEFTGHTLAETNASGQFSISIKGLAGDLQAYALAPSPERGLQVEQSIAEAGAHLAMLDELEAHAGREEEPGSDMHGALGMQRAVLLANAVELLNRLKHNDPAVRRSATAELQDFAELVDLLEVDARALQDAELREGLEASNVAVAQAQRSLAAAFTFVLLATLGGLSLAYFSVVRPLAELASAASLLSERRLERAVRVGGPRELATLQRAFNRMAETIRAALGGLERQIAMAEAAQRDAEAAHAQSEARLATIEAQGEALRALSVPVLPLSAGALVIPLVGALDAERLELLELTALEAIERLQVRHLVLDVTGVPLIDQSVASGLTRVIGAARLLGAGVVLVGIRPEVAQTLAGLSCLLEGVATYSTLQRGVESVLQDPARRQS